MSHTKFFTTSIRSAGTGTDIFATTSPAGAAVVALAAPKGTGRNTLVIAILEHEDGPEVEKRIKITKISKTIIYLVLHGPFLY